MIPTLLLSAMFATQPIAKNSTQLPPVDLSGLPQGSPANPDPEPKPKDLCDAIYDGDLALIRRIVSANPGALKEPVGRGKLGDESPLLLASNRRKGEVVKLLLELGADVNQKGSQSGHTPLMAAAIEGPSEAADTLLKAGAKLDPFSAAGLGKVDELRKMIDEAKREGKENEFVNAKSSLGWAGAPLLNWAVLAGQYRTAELLLERGANPNPFHDESSAYDQNPLHVAVRYQAYAFIPLLLRHGANPELRNGDGLTPLHTAVFGYDGSDLIAIAYLVVGGARHTGKSNWHAMRLNDITVRNVKSGWNPARGFSDIVEEEATRETGITPLHYAAGTDSTRAVLLMLALGVPVNPIDRENMTPLDTAMMSKHSTAAWVLRQFGGRSACEQNALGELVAERIQRPVWVPRRPGEAPDEYVLANWMHPEITPELLRVVGTRWKGAGWNRGIWYFDSAPYFRWECVQCNKRLRDAEVPPAWMDVRR